MSTRPVRRVGVRAARAEARAGGPPQLPIYGTSVRHGDGGQRFAAAEGWLEVFANKLSSSWRGYDPSARLHAHQSRSTTPTALGMPGRIGRLRTARGQARAVSWRSRALAEFRSSAAIQPVARRQNPAWPPTRSRPGWRGHAADRWRQYVLKRVGDVHRAPTRERYLMHSGRVEEWTGAHRRARRRRSSLRMFFGTSPRSPERPVACQ